MPDRFTDYSPLAEGEPQILELIEGNGVVKLGRLGARLTLKLAGNQVLTSFNSRRYDGKPAVSHPCTPNFGPYGKEYKLPQHGPVRSGLWSLLAFEPALSGGSVKLGYEIQHKGYPEGVYVTYTAALQNGVLKLRTLHEQRGKDPAPVVFGHHLYWAAGYGGWEAVTLNGNSIADLIRSNGISDLKEENRLVIPGKPDVLLSQKGLPKAVFWVMSHGDEGALEYDQLYFCLEPVEADPRQFGQEETIIEPGGSRATELSISLAEEGL